MFTVELQVLLSAEAHRDQIGLSRSIQLPFAPFPGLVLYGLMEDPESPIYIDEVAYDVADRTFFCGLESDEYSPDDIEDDDVALTIGEKIAQYGDEWEVNEPGEDANKDD